MPKDAVAELGGWAGQAPPRKRAVARRNEQTLLLAAWIRIFVDFLVTKHGLAAALRSDNASFEALRTYFLDRLVPVCDQLLAAAADAGEIRSDVTAYELMYGIGNLCVGLDSDSRYDARRLIELLVAGLRQR